jgi:hypothetical protein
MFAALSGQSAHNQCRTLAWRDPRPTKSWTALTSALSFLSVAGTQTQPELLDPRTTALNQDNQNDNNQHTGNNPDDHSTVHVSIPPSLMIEPLE